MLVPAIAHLMAAAAPATRPPPEVTCNGDAIRFLEADSRTRSFDPTVNDVTSDGSGIAVQRMDAPPAAAGSLSRLDNACILVIREGYAGSFDLAYDVVSDTGAEGSGVVSVIVDGVPEQPVCNGAPDTIRITTAATTADFDVIANDETSGPAEIMPGSLVQPNGGPTIAIAGDLLRVTRNGAAAGDYTGGSYRPRLKDGSLTGVATALTIRVQAETVAAADFTVNVSIAAGQPYVIDALALCSGTSAVELSPAGLTQPTGASDTAAIQGSGPTGKIAYTRSTTPAGTYSMTYKVRLVSNPAIEAVGTITIKVVAKWWIRARTAQRDWPAGPGYVPVSEWVSKIGRLDAMTQRSKAPSRTDLDGVTGGPKTDSLTNPSLEGGSQMDRNNAFWKNVAAITPDSAFIVPVIEMVPEIYTTQAKAGGSPAYWDRCIRGDYDADFARMGARYKKMMQVIFGWTDMDRLVLRPNHEMNQSNIYQVYPDTRMQYRAAMERMLEKMRDGAGWRIRVVHSPARNLRIAANYADWVPQSADGGVDCLTLSYHPGNQITNFATYDKFMDQWDNSSYGTTGDVIPACQALGLPYANPEWSPRYGEGNLPPCDVADMVVQQFTKFMRQQYYDGNLVFETMFDHILDRDKYILSPYGSPDGQAAWRRMYDQIVQIYTSRTTVAPAYLRCTPINVSGGGPTIDIDPIAASTGSDPIRINRIVADPAGATTAAITGSAAAARVRIARNGAGSGAVSFPVEMTLSTMPYLTDLKVTVTWT